MCKGVIWLMLAMHTPDFAGDAQIVTWVGPYDNKAECELHLTSQIAHWLSVGVPFEFMNGQCVTEKGE